MPVSYKLRLGDGTVLVVDHDGLSNWVVDNKAMVQLVGSTHWRPLKAFLSAERAAARNAAREKPGPATVLPLIPPPPRKEEPPPPAEPPPSEPVEPLTIGEPPAAEVPLEEPAAPVRTRLDSKAGEAFPPIPPPRREEAPRQAEPEPSEPDEPLFPSAPRAAEVPIGEPAVPLGTQLDSKAHEAIPHIPKPRREPIPPPRREEAPRQPEPPPIEPDEPLFRSAPRAAEVPLREPAVPLRTQLDSKAREAIPPISPPRKEPIPPPRREEAPRQAEPPPSEPDEPLFRSAPPAAEVPRESVEPEPADKVADAAWSEEASRRLEEVLPGEHSAPGGALPPPRAEETPRYEPEPPPIEPVEPLILGEPPAVQVPIQSVEPEPADEGADADWSAEGRRRLEEVLPWGTAAPVRTRQDSKAGDSIPSIAPGWEAPRQAEPPPSDSVEPLILGEPPALQTLGDVPVVPPAESVSHEATPNQYVAPIPQEPVDDAADNRPAASPWSEPLEPSIGAQPNLMVLADDVAGPHSANTVLRPVPIDELPIIRLKPRDDQEKVPDDVGKPAAHEARPWQDARDEKFFRSVSAVGGFLSVWLGRLERLLGRLPSIRPERAPSAAFKSDALEAPPPVRVLPKPQVLAEEPTKPRDGFTRGSSTPDPVLPIPPPQPRGKSQAPQDAPSKPQKLRAGPDPHEPLKAPPPISEPFREHLNLGRSHEPLMAPPPISELPILRLADIHEPKAPNDVYGGDAYEGGSLVRTAWRWTKRGVVITVLLAGGTLAALTWKTWSPKAVRLSRTVFTEIDKRARSRDETERKERALQEAAQQLPHLAPATIELVSSGRVLDPPEVFRLACDAADRGLSALAPAEAQELKALRQEMVEKLRPEERQRAREYDVARRRGPTLPIEDRAALELVAHSARALPPASRVRLQVLSGKAIAVGLVPAPPVGQRRPQAD